MRAVGCTIVRISRPGLPIGLPRQLFYEFADLLADLVRIVLVDDAGLQIGSGQLEYRNQQVITDFDDGRIPERRRDELIGLRAVPGQQSLVKPDGSAHGRRRAEKLVKNSQSR